MIKDSNAENEKILQPRFTLPLSQDSAFPFHALPHYFQNVVDETHKVTTVSMELIVATMLASSSLAAQGLARVSAGDHKSSGCGLFILAIAEPSEGKSSVERIFFKPFQDFEEKERANMETQLIRYRVEMITWQAGISKIKSAIYEEVRKNATL
ncbi:MAG: DUF3987 domain-containing protein [Burkholderiales bacterium]